MPSADVPGQILVINAGSSSIRFALFDAELTSVVSGIASGIGTARQSLRIGRDETDAGFADHKSALAAILSALEKRGSGPETLAAAAHRVVHGGAKLTRTEQITPGVLDEIEAVIPLAPLHNPHNLAAIRVLREIAPSLPQAACFDTAFHATNPDVAARYAIPRELEERGIRRYGFHGTSYAALAATFSEVTGEALPPRLLALHLGNGASICAIREGASVATTMGYSPLEGLTMGTRSGSIDPNAVLRIAEDQGIDRAKELLNTESGLKALSGGTSDMAQLLADPSPEAAFAVEHFCYWAARHAAGLIPAMGGVDAIAFTGGIGENAGPVRARILGHLDWLGLALDEDANAADAARLHRPGSGVALWTIPAREEWMIAREAVRVLGAAAS